MKKRKEEIIIVKEITYLRIFIILVLLMLIDILSSYFAVSNLNAYEINSISRFAFNLGIFGLVIVFIFFIYILSLFIIGIYCIETTFFKYNKQEFRMKIFYIILGMYAFVFGNNLRVLFNLIF